jgi:hypothetical protein
MVMVQGQEGRGAVHNASSDWSKNSLNFHGGKKRTTTSSRLPQRPTGIGPVPRTPDFSAGMQSRPSGAITRLFHFVGPAQQSGMTSANTNAPHDLPLTSNHVLHTTYVLCTDIHVECGGIRKAVAGCVGGCSMTSDLGYKCVGTRESISRVTLFQAQPLKKPCFSGHAAPWLIVAIDLRI